MEGSFDEAFDLLQNGIFVETSRGLVCMSLNDAISSDLNLSVEDLTNVATELISQQNVPVIPKTRLNFDSDGFSSECSDASAPPNYIFGATPSTSKAVTFRPVEIKTAQEISKTDNAITLAGPSDILSSPATILDVHKPPKRRGGWPKGRKRKPELMNLPPKAPATGYNLYLNEQRKLFKDSKLVFHEITKIIGNRWSSLSLEEKRPYLAKAEEDKRRYREELKQYRQSDAYRAYLAKKRKNRLQNNVLSESDMDATDEIDEEDNEELYCRTCDQWFHNLHNKREHLQGRQHTQSVAGDIKRELDTNFSSDSGLFTSLDESSLDATPLAINVKADVDQKKERNLITDSMNDLVGAVKRRENEIKSLQQRLLETSLKHTALCQQVHALRQRHVKLKSDLNILKEEEHNMEAKVAQLWQVPSWFVITDFNTETSTDFNETTSE